MYSTCVFNKLASGVSVFMTASLTHYVVSPVISIEFVLLISSNACFFKTLSSHLRYRTPYESLHMCTATCTCR